MRDSIRRRCRALAAAFALAAALAAGAQPAVAAAPPTPAAGAATTAEPPVLPPSKVDADTYIVGPGDVIQVFVWRNPELSTTTPVLPDGRVSTPLAEGIVATGKTPAQLARDIEKALSEYVREPRVSIIVTEPRSTYSQIKLVGQFKNPSAIAYRDGMKVMDAVLEAGGLGEYAAGNRARILRKVNGKDTQIRVKLQSLMEKGDLKQNIELQPGDILVVPETRF